MKYKVEFKKTFFHDYNQIVENCSENILRKFSIKVSTKMTQIMNFPQSCPLLKDPHYFESGIRWVPILEKYILIYLFEKETIFFLRILIAKRNWINKLFDPETPIF